MSGYRASDVGPELARGLVLRQSVPNVGPELARGLEREAKGHWPRASSGPTADFRRCSPERELGEYVRSNESPCAHAQGYFKTRGSIPGMGSNTRRQYEYQRIKTRADPTTGAEFRRTGGEMCPELPHGERTSGA